MKKIEKETILDIFKKSRPAKFEDAVALLEASGFKQRKSWKNHCLFVNEGVYVVLDTVRDLRRYAKREVIRAIEASTFDEEL